MGLLDRQYMHPSNCNCPKCNEYRNRGIVERSLLQQLKIDQNAQSLTASSIVECPLCGSKTKLRISTQDSHKYFVCINYPKCTGRRRTWL
jgi:ssDNA-binding Zn-finger/Zn-ribbon topoisomerase 1